LKGKEITTKLGKIAYEFEKKVQDCVKQTDLNANEKRLLTYSTLASPIVHILKSLPDDERTYLASELIKRLLSLLEPEKQLPLLGTNYISASIAVCRRDPQDMLPKFLASLCTITDHGVKSLPKRLHKDIYSILEDFYATKRRRFLEQNSMEEIH